MCIKADLECLPEVRRELEAQHGASVITNTQERVGGVEDNMSQLSTLLLDH